MNHNLRTCRPEDAETIIGWFSTHQDAVIWGGPDVPNPLTASWLAQQFLDAYRRYYVLTDETGRICGTYFLYPMPEECRVHLGRFAVAPNLRRRGLASLMIQYAMDAARSYDAQKLTLKVYDHNLAARRVYDRAGFCVTKGAPVEPDRYGIAVPMSFDLSSA
jgi:RimJ/RimL family protein N-acetyltransferase